MNEGSFDIEEYIARIAHFHGFAAPGVIIGGFMVHMARAHMPEGKLFNAICETPKCLPDSIQLLTPCTIGNGRLRILDFGRFALSLYEKCEGRGFRVFIESESLGAWPEIRAWFLRSKPKAEQDHQRLVREIKEAGERLCGVRAVQVHPRFLERPKQGAIGVCRVCGEAYPSEDGNVCRACQGLSPYIMSECLERSA